MGSLLQSFHFGRKTKATNSFAPQEQYFTWNPEQIFVLTGIFENISITRASGSHLSMSQPYANFWIHRLSPILQKTLKRLKVLPGRNSQNLELLLKDCSDILLDGVERNIQRLQDTEQQQDYCSGKKNA